MTLYLAGGGSYSQEALVWREAFSGITRAVYWPFALPDDRIPDAASWLHAALHDLGIKVRVDIWPSLEHRSTARSRMVAPPNVRCEPSCGSPRWV